MGKHVEAAAQLFSSGCNCAQSVFAALAPELGMDRESALAVALGFGGGMGRLQRTCGAVTGAIMLLGLRYGADGGADAKKRCYEKVRELVAGFEARHGSSECRTLLGFDLGTPEGVARAHESCGPLVEEAIRTVGPMVVGSRS
jgi:C_GCAxxG_C_C family probable redox protein